MEQLLRERLHSEHSTVLQQEILFRNFVDSFCVEFPGWKLQIHDACEITSDAYYFFCSIQFNLNGFVHQNDAH